MMAQAVAERCQVVTLDKVFSDYQIPVLWYQGVGRRKPRHLGVKIKAYFRAA